MSIDLEGPKTELRPQRTTYLPRVAGDDLPPDAERVKVGAGRNAVFAVVGAMFAGLAVGLLLSAGLGVIGIGWMPIVSFGWFIAIYAVLAAVTDLGPAVKDRFWTVMFASAGVVVVGALAIVIVFVLFRGQDVITDMFSFPDGRGFLDMFHFLTKDMSGVGPLAGLEEGGILHALVATLEQIGIALAITVPLGLLTAVFLNEVGGRFARLVRTIVEAMTALPSVVAGLFIYAAVIILFTRDTNGFAASLAITVLMLPIMIRSADVVLRLVPGNLREAGLALGAGQWRVVLHVVLPTVRSGLTTAIILATAHGIGETAPVLLTSGVTSNLNLNPFFNKQTSLPLAALEFVKSPQPAMVARGFATAAFLLIVVLILFVLARVAGGGEAGKFSAGKLRKLARQSREQLPRVDANFQQGLTQRSATESQSPRQQDNSEPRS